MITEFFFNLFFDFALFVLRLVPAPVFISLDTSGILDIIGYGVYIITPTVFVLIFTNILFWSTQHLTFSIIKFVWSTLRG